MDLHALRARLGGHVSAGGRQWRGPGPGHSRNDDSLSVSLAADGRALLHSFAGDDFRLCAAHVGLERAEPINRERLDALERRRRGEQARESEAAGRLAEGLWAETDPLEGSQAEAYLFSRGLILETTAIRYHREAPRRRDSAPGGPAPHPAMAALAVDLFGRARAIHFTFLREGQKAFSDRSRLIFGRPAGCAVRLAEIGRDGRLAIAEGLETAASYAALKGVPTWAGLNRAGVAGFLAPAGVRELVAAADGDAPGREAAQALRSRCRTSPRRLTCEVDAAPDAQDWNDVLQARTGRLYAAT